MNKLATVGLLLAGFAVGALAQSHAGPRRALQQGLAQRYRLTEVGPSMLGLLGDRSSIRRAGGVVVLRRAGLYGSLERDQPASFGIREGTAELFRGRKDQAFAVGERFYVHSAHVGSDVVTLGLVTVRTVTTPAGAGQLWAAASFFFPPATLAEGNVGSVFRLLDQWLLPEEALRPVATEAPVVAEAPVVKVRAPADLKAGMTREEVVAALGTPQREVSFGTRVWLTYPGMVVLLEGGKLASVDRSGQPPAKVKVVSEPDGADVLLDGSFVSSTPATLELPAGTYKVTVQLPGYQAWEREVRVLGGSEITLRARLAK